MSEADIVIAADRLNKSYKNIQAVRDFTIDIRRGETIGLLGADGAGKTTALQLLAGALAPTSGTVRRQSREDGLGYMSEGFSLYPTLSVEENVDFFAAIHKVPRAERQSLKRDLLSASGLDVASGRQAQYLSGGMQKKLALACALINRPELLFLDEPTTGVDPVSRREFWKILAQFVATGTTVVVTTPYMDEAERFDRVVFLREGEVIALDAAATLETQLKGRTFEGESSDSYATARSMEEDSSAQAIGERVRIVFANQLGVDAARERFAHAGGKPETLHEVQAHLEDVFVDLLASQNNGVEMGDDRPGPATPIGAPSAIAVQAVTKRFGSFVALDALSLDVRPGEIFGLLGPNGSGKSTLIRILSGILRPTQGRAAVAGFDVASARHAVKSAFGYMSQKFSLYRDLTVEENVDLSAGFYGIKKQALRERKAAALQYAGLEGKERILTRDLAAGWRQRLALECALLHRPSVIFLDEPTAGVDPLMRRRFWRSIRSLGKAGASVIVTTHYMDEAEQCDRIAFLDDGKIIALGTPLELKRQTVAGSLWEVRASDSQRALSALQANASLTDAALYGKTIRVQSGEADPQTTIQRILNEAAVSVDSITQTQATLEDVFVALVERRERSAA
jgi:ABC-2 type transport system ATP-binding protein